MSIDPQLQHVLKIMRDAGMPKFGSVPVTTMREMYRRKPPVVTQLWSVDDLTIPTNDGEIAGRIYRPSASAPALIIFYHGGGWVMGSTDSSDASLRSLAERTGYAILSVDYRLAPEHRFPAAVNDAFAALKWASGHKTGLTGNQSPILIVMGESAGGNLAAVVTQLARDEGGPEIAQQVLIYPATDGNLDNPDLTKIETPLLSVEEGRWAYDQYADQASRNDPRLAPSKAETLVGLPPAVIITAEHDVLTPEGRRYGAMLRAAGVSVTDLHYLGAIHGFFSIGPGLELGRRVIDELAESMQLLTDRPYTNAAALGLTGSVTY